MPVSDAVYLDNLLKSLQRGEITPQDYDLLAGVFGVKRNSGPPPLQTADEVRRDLAQMREEPDGSFEDMLWFQESQQKPTEDNRLRQKLADYLKTSESYYPPKSPYDFLPSAEVPWQTPPPWDKKFRLRPNDGANYIIGYDSENKKWEDGYVDKFLIKPPPVVPETPYPLRKNWEMSHYQDIVNKEGLDSLVNELDVIDDSQIYIGDDGVLVDPEADTEMRRAFTESLGRPKGKIRKKTNNSINIMPADKKKSDLDEIFGEEKSKKKPKTGRVQGDAEDQLLYQQTKNEIKQALESGSDFEEISDIFYGSQGNADYSDLHDILAEFGYTEEDGEIIPFDPKEPGLNDVDRDGDPEFRRQEMLDRMGFDKGEKRPGYDDDLPIDEKGNDIPDGYLPPKPSQEAPMSAYDEILKQIQSGKHHDMESAIEDAFTRGEIGDDDYQSLLEESGKQSLNTPRKPESSGYQQRAQDNKDMHNIPFNKDENFDRVSMLLDSPMDEGDTEDLMFDPETKTTQDPEMLNLLERLKQLSPSIFNSR